LQIAGLQLGENCGLAADRVKERRNVVRFLQAPAIEVIAPPECDDPPLSEESVELERLELQPLKIIERCSCAREMNSRMYRKPAGHSDRFSKSPACSMAV
jgi:hypothetical protein